MKRTGPRWFGLMVSSILLCGPNAWSQASRTWVSGVGDDANPCTRTAPCKTFAGAISKTAAKGEINVLDPGAYGAVTITKSISITSEGFEAGVLTTGATNGIIINAAASDVIVLRGLDLEGFDTGLAGINFLVGGALHVENCTIQNFNQNAIFFRPSVAAKLYVKDSIVRNNLDPNTPNGGILIEPTGSGSATVFLENVSIANNTFGLKINGGGIKATLRNTQIVGNTNHGVFVNFTAGNPVDVALEHVLISGNLLVGVNATGSGATVRLADTTVTGSPIGIEAANAARLISWGDNHISGNTTDGDPTSTVVPK